MSEGWEIAGSISTSKWELFYFNFRSLYITFIALNLHYLCSFELPLFLFCVYQRHTFIGYIYCEKNVRKVEHTLSTLHLPKVNFDHFVIPCVFANYARIGFVHRHPQGDTVHRTSSRQARTERKAGKTRFDLTLVAPSIFVVVCLLLPIGTSDVCLSPLGSTRQETENREIERSRKKS